MAEQESRFIKTVAFGGYDRTDVDNRLKALYSQVFELKNELIESKLMLEKLTKGSETEKAQEFALAVERGKLTELQVKNKSLSDKLKRYEDTNKVNEKKITDLREETEKLKASLEDANSELSAFRAGGDVSSLSAVFIEAQKSKELLLVSAKAEAEKLKSDSEKLAENIISDADNKAAIIIYEAEKRAAEISAEALNGSEQMKIASENMKAAMLQDLLRISKQVDTLKKAMEFFESEGFNTINNAEDLIKNTEAELKAGKVPVFTAPAEIKPDYPEPPELKNVNFSFDDGSKDKPKKGNSGLDKLQAMAESIIGDTKNSVSPDGSAKQADSPEASEKQDNKKGLSLADLAKQAESIGSNDNADKPDNVPEKNSSPPQAKKINLADLAKQAESIGSNDNTDKPDNVPEKTSSPPQAKKMNLADLAKQADAIGSENEKSGNDSVSNNTPNAGIEPDELDELAELAKQAEALLKK